MKLNWDIDTTWTLFLDSDGVINERAAQPVAPQQAGIGAFAHQVQLVGEDVLKLGDDGQRPQPPRQR